MKKTVIYIYSYMDYIDKTAVALSEHGYIVILSPTCKWADDRYDIIDKSYLEKYGVIRGGLAYIKDKYPDNNVILADEVANAEDILLVLSELEDNDSTLILGAGKYQKELYSKFQRFSYFIISKLYGLVQGKYIHDIFRGVRGIPSKYIESFIKLKGDGCDFLINQVMVLRSMSIPIKEIRITTHTSMNVPKNIIQLLKRIIQITYLLILFASSSFASFILDTFIAWLVYTYFASMLSEFINNILVNLDITRMADPEIISIVLARIISSIFNFIINKKLVFSVHTSKGKFRIFIEYYALVLCVLLGSTAILKLLTVNGYGFMPAKIAADIIIYLVSFILQRDIIFKTKSII